MHISTHYVIIDFIYSFGICSGLDDSKKDIETRLYFIVNA